jgi:hypothetical protein
MPQNAQKRIGRPTAWNAETAFMIGYGLGKGLSHDAVAKLAGLSRATLFRYITKGVLGDERFQRLAESIDDQERFGDIGQSQNEN